MSTMTCNEEVKGNTKCKISRFEFPFGGLSGNAQGSSMAQWKVRCRIVYKTAHYPIASTFVPKITADCMLVADV